MAIFVELYLKDLDDEPSGASVKIFNDKDSTHNDVVTAFEEVYTGLTAALDRIDAADQPAPPSDTLAAAAPATA